MLPLYDQYREIYCLFSSLEAFNSDDSSIVSVAEMRTSHCIIMSNETNHGYVIHTCLFKAIKGTVMDQTR